MELYEYEEKYYKNLDNGVPKREGIRHAINAALEQHDWKGALDLYYEFMHEDVFYCDSYQSIIVFPEYLALFENHPELQDCYQYDVMWVYKWVVGNIDDFYQIPMSQIVNIYKQYYDFCTRFGYSKRTYYHKLWNLLYDNGCFEYFDVESVQDCHKKMMESPKDSMDDCRACELNDEVDYILDVENDIEKALQKAKPIFSGKRTCAEIPHLTYLNFAKYYFEHGDLTEAKIYLDKGWRLFERDFGNEGSVMYRKGQCVMLYAYMDLPKAFKLFKKYFSQCYMNKGSHDSFMFYRGAYHLMLQLEKDGKKTVHMSFPFKSEPIYNPAGEYSVAELKEFMYNKAKFFADKFDERNGNSKYNDKLAEMYEFDYSNCKLEEIFSAPVLDYIRDSMENGVLPEDFYLPEAQKTPDGKYHFADGALDGICIYHTEPKYESANELIELIKLASDGGVKKAAVRIERYFKNNDVRMLPMIDNLQKYISENKKELDIENIYYMAIELVVGAKNKEAVKCGLSIFELFSIFNDALKEAIMNLALSDEFTLYAIWVISNWEDKNERIFEIAQKTHGWGRIHAVHALEPDNDKIKEWLLREGWQNNVTSEYSARTCLVKSDISELLKEGLKDKKSDSEDSRLLIKGCTQKPELTRDRLTLAGKLISLSLSDGPVGNISKLENADEILEDYISCVEKLEHTEDDIKTVKEILEYTKNEQLKNKCQQFLNSN